MIPRGDPLISILHFSYSHCRSCEFFRCGRPLNLIKTLETDISSLNHSHDPSPTCILSSFTFLTLFKESKIGHKATFRQDSWKRERERERWGGGTLDRICLQMRNKMLESQLQVLRKRAVVKFVNYFTWTPNART